MLVWVYMHEYLYIHFFFSAKELQETNFTIQLENTSIFKPNWSYKNYNLPLFSNNQLLFIRLCSTYLNWFAHFQFLNFYKKNEFLDMTANPLSCLQ